MTPVDRPLTILGIAMMLAAWVHPLFYIGVLIMLLDVRARWVDYRSIRHERPSYLRLRLMRGSWCSRGVAEFVWPEYSRTIYRHLGYRWYHILPDGAPKCFLDVRFWRHVVGIGR